MVVRYKSKKTGSVVTYRHPIPRLEKDARYERVDDKPKKAPAKGDTDKPAS